MKLPLEKHTLRLREGDVDRLRDLYPDVPANKIIRRIVSNHVDKIEPKLSERELDNLMEEGGDE